jgi:hypothetical protein
MSIPKQKKDYITNITLKKLSNKNTVQKYLSIDKGKKALNLEFCFNQFYAEKYKHKSQDLEKFKSKPLTTCKNKFCNICSYIRSRKTFVQTYKAIENMKNDGYEFIAYHLTLTIKNPYTFDILESYNIMNKAFHNFIHKYKELDKYLMGWQCGREISQNSDAKKNNEFHPHIHCLLLLSVDFYNEKTRNRKITQKQFRQKWTNSCAFYNIEAYKIKFKPIKSNEDFINLENCDAESDPFLSAISEVAKYPTKPADIQKMSNEHFDILDNVLHKKRQLSTGGLLKEYLAKQKEEEILNISNYELIDVLFCDYNNKKFKNYNVKVLNDKEKDVYLLNQQREEQSRKMHKEFKQSDKYKKIQELKKLKNSVDINYTEQEIEKFYNDYNDLRKIEFDKIK